MYSDKSKNHVTVHWFRHGLRLHDNPVLVEGLASCSTFYPVFIFDGHVAGTSTSGYNRWRFLLESLEDLDKSLRKFGSQLYVFHGDPVEIFRKLFIEWKVTCLTFENDPEPIWRERDDLVRSLCLQRRVAYIEKVSHTLWDPKLICEKNGGVPPVTYMLFHQVAHSLDAPCRPESDPDFTGIELPQQSNLISQVPTLESLGIKPECPQQTKRINQWKGGEMEALRLYKDRINIEEKAFKGNIVLPNQAKVDLTGPPMSMSAHLRFGCLSIRKLYWGILDAYLEIKGEEAPVGATAQLMWREYFYTMSVNNTRYNTVKGNAICLNIPWDEDEKKVKKWLHAETGFPWIDAIMTQLRHEGWIHQVARHATACFLTRGDLWQSWEKGLEVFDKYLLDADWSVCAGNWMWVASSAFEDVLQCPRCFCPVRYGIRMDPTGAYIRRYLPILKDMPLKFLFSPWKAPLAIQEKAKCVIGKDYPQPMVDHHKVANENKKYMENAKMLHRIEKEIQGYVHPSGRNEVGQLAFLPEYLDKNIQCLANQACQALRIEDCLD